MNTEVILEQVTKIFRQVLDNQDIVLTAATTANDIQEWDSLNHLQLVVAIEKHFKIKFTATEIRSWENVGAICESISKRTENN